MRAVIEAVQTWSKILCRNFVFTYLDGLECVENMIRIKMYLAMCQIAGG